MTPRVFVVTGATGFTGPFVVRALRRRFPAATLRCLLRPSSDPTRLDGTAAERVYGDLRDPASLARAFEGADTLVHVASLGFDWVDPLFEAVAGSRLSRGVFIGTTAILTNLPVRSRPMREHGEHLVRTSGLAWTLLRPTMIYGTPADRNISRLIRFVLRSPVIPLVAGDARQQPIHVEDVADAVAAALANDGTIGRIYNIAGREPVTFERLVRTVVRLAGVRRAIVPIPAAPLRAAAAVYGRLVRRPWITSEQVARLHEHKAFDYADAARDFGFSPRSFEDGVRAEIAMMRHPA